MTIGTISDGKAIDFFAADKESVEFFAKEMLNGFVYCKIIVDKSGKPIDYVYVYVNDAYERITGSKRERVVGKNATELFPDLVNDPADWIGKYGRVAISGKPEKFEALLQFRNVWYSLLVYSPQRGYFVALFEDVTERKKAEEALKESEQLYRTLFENTDDAFQLLKPLYDEADNPRDLLLLKVNKAYERQTGLKAGDVVGKTVKEYLPNLEPFWISTYNNVAKTGKSTHIENYNQSTNRWYDVYAFLYRKDQVGALFRDITERKQAEEALRLSEERFQQLVEQSPVVFEVYDTQGFQIRVNAAFEKFWDIPKELTLGKYNILKSEQVIKNNLLQYVERAYAGEIVNVPDYQYDASLEPSTGGLGRKRWLNATLYPLRDEQGKVIGIVVLHEDITERKNAEQALRESEKKFQSIIEQSPDVFGLYDENCFLIQVNKAWDNLWDVPRELAIGKWNPLQSKQVRDIGWVPLIKRAYAGETVDVPETEFDPSLELLAAGKGRKRWIKSKIYPIKNAHNEVRNIVMTHQDITDRKLLERQLQDKERMAVIGQTAGMVGHDIRNPLQAIVSELFLAKQAMIEAKDKDTKEALESIDLIQEQVDYINKIVADLQDYARPLNPEYTDVDIEDLLVKVFERVVVPNKVTLKVDVKGTVRLKTDATFIQRALTNLVNNAIQAMPDGGELELSAQKKEECVVISVSDTGQGIPENVKANLFTPLTTTKAKGQGLGLAVVKRLVEGLNGKVSFESKEGKGTKFTIELTSSSAQEL